MNNTLPNASNYGFIAVLLVALFWGTAGTMATFPPNKGNYFKFI